MTKPEDRCSFGQHIHQKFPNYDARGIFLTYTCVACHDEKMAGYRQDVLDDPAYWADEEIDGD